jgi:hypothetical protein
MSAILQVDKIKHLFNSCFSDYGRNAIKAGMELKVFDAGKNSIKGEILEDDAHIAPHLRRLIHYVITGD